VSIFDLYQKFETLVRTPKKRMLLDAFLPAPETLPSAVAPPPPPPMANLSPDEVGMLSRLDREEEEPAPPPRPAKKRKTAEKKKEAPKSLQDEIAEFMNRDGTALAPEEDLKAFLNNSLDPNADPEPGSGDKS
jgi:hypothetical protein